MPEDASPITATSAALVRLLTGGPASVTLERGVLLFDDGVADRRRQGLTLRELSGRSGVALSCLSEIERGRKPGSVAALTRVAETFGTTIDALVID